MNESFHKEKTEYWKDGGRLALSVSSQTSMSRRFLIPTEDDPVLKSQRVDTLVSGSTSVKPPNPKKPQQNSNSFLEGMTQSVNATYDSSLVISRMPSDAPSSVPSQFASDELSGIPSDVPSLTPSDAPSLAPTLVFEDDASRQPNYSPPVPAPIRSFSPSAVPSETYIETSSAIPTLVETNKPTANGSLTPTKVTGKGSRPPTVLNSNRPSAKGSVTRNPVTELPSAHPTASKVDSDGRTPKPTQQPIQPVVSTPSPGPSQNPTDAPSIFVDTDNNGQGETIHSTVQLLDLTTLAETELNEDDVRIFQNLCKREFLPTFLPKTYNADYNKIDCQILNQNLGKQRKLQEENDSSEFVLSILLQVRSEVKLPDNVAFSNIVALTFHTYSDELLSLLGSMAYFPAVDVSDKGPIITEIQGEENPTDTNKGITSTMLAGALLGGAVLAIVVSMLIIRRSRQSREVGANRSRPKDTASSSVRSIPRVIGFATDGVLVERGDAFGPPSVASESSHDAEQVTRRANMECKSRTNSAERTEGSGSLDSSLHGLDILQSSVSSEESKLADKKLIARFIGRRRKSDESNNKLNESFTLNPLASEDICTDLECGADSTNKVQKKTKTDSVHKLAKKESDVGENILQMQLDNAAHTGEVLNDLGQFEEQWHDRLTRVRVSASAETPRQRNTTQYSRPPRSRSMIFSSMSNDVLSEFTDAESL